MNENYENNENYEVEYTEEIEYAPEETEEKGIDLKKVLLVGGGIAAAIGGGLFLARKKIKKAVIKSLRKKGYYIEEPQVKATKAEGEEVLEEIVNEEE